MNPSPFQQCCAFVIDIEGGDKIVNDPRDAGGTTKFGISARSFPLTDIATLTRGEAEAIYEQSFWNRAGCAGLPAPLAALHFDCAVNQGVTAAAEILQITLMVRPDGQIGPKTLAAANCGNVRAHVTEYAARRMRRYATTKNFDLYGLGWSRRLMACFAYALTLGEPL